MAESKVTGIIQSLTGLEDDLDSLNTKVSEMKKQLSMKAQTEIDKLLEKTKDMALKEAEVIINASREKANTESKRIAQDGEDKLSEIKSKIDSNFDEAVRHVVSTVLKA
ncbi:MAG: conserved oligomeric Golgi complex subunit 6 [Nitrosopumilus sp.]|nr:conserved oligomeric Golgi complex subunit 6 [Nitrosopumilus sp.]MDH3384568.1 conserved oligomeric Golgi complex subunit 6 [Nitrosopumilus sp.]